MLRPAADGAAVKPMIAQGTGCKVRYDGRSATKARRAWLPVIPRISRQDLEKLGEGLG